MARRYCKECRTYHDDEAVCPTVAVDAAEAKATADTLRGMLHALLGIKVDAGSEDPLEDLSTAEGSLSRLYRHYKAKAAGGVK